MNRFSLSSCLLIGALATLAGCSDDPGSPGASAGSGGEGQGAGNPGGQGGEAPGTGGGEGGSGASGGSGGDGGAGGAGGGASGGTAKLRVFSGGVAIEGAKVVVYGPDGNVTSRLETGPGGEATANVEPDAAVTVVVTSAKGGETRHFVTTVVDVDPGDVLTVGDTGGDPDAEIGEARVTLPGPRPAAVKYFLDLGGTAGEVISPLAEAKVPISAESLSPSNTLTVVAEAQDPSGAPLAYAVAPDVPRDAAGNASASLGPWRTDWQKLDVVFENLPPGAGFTSAYPVYAADGVLYARSWPKYGEVKNGTSTLAFSHARDVFDALLLEAQVDFFDGPTPPPVGTGMLRRWQKGVFAQAKVDVTAELLPAVGPFTRDLSDPAAPSVSWKTSNDLSAADALVVQFGWLGGSWYVVAPAKTPSPFAPPRLPEDLEGIVSGPEGFEFVEVAFVEASHAADYAAFKALGWEQVDGTYETPPGETLRVSQAREEGF